MRRNSFHEAYCHSVDELIDELDRKDLHWSQVCCAKVVEDRDAEDADRRWSGRILENGSGKTVCHVEGASREIAEAVVLEAGIDLQG